MAPFGGSCCSIGIKSNSRVLTASDLPAIGDEDRDLTYHHLELEVEDYCQEIQSMATVIASLKKKMTLKGSEMTAMLHPLTAPRQSNPDVDRDLTHHHLQLLLKNHLQEIKSMATAVPALEKKIRQHGSQMAAILRQLDARTILSSAPTHGIGGIVKTIKGRLGAIVKTIKVRPFEHSSDLEKEIPIWSRDLENHYCGQFSCAMVAANTIVEDQSQVEAGSRATFVGIYDGHAGFYGSRYVCHYLYAHLRRLAIAQGTISEEIIRNAFEETENGFLGVIRRDFERNQLIASCGSCCLVGVIWNDTIYTANLGDSRAVIGYDAEGVITAEQLTSDHTCKLLSVRNELEAAHPTDRNIVIKKTTTWRIRGVLRVSRAIGDAHLKHPEFALEPSYSRFHLSEPLTVPVLRADPDIHIRHLQPRDKFIIYASNGFWNLVTNEEAVQIVHENSRLGIAKRLIESALQKVAISKQMKLSALMKKSLVSRRINYHNDISVVVMFFDKENADFAGELSVRGFTE